MNAWHPNRRPRVAATRLAVALAFGVVAAWPGLGTAGTTGKISGRVLDAKKQPLASANVVIPAIRAGTATDADGYYNLLDLPPGSYDVKVSLLGYRSVTNTGVAVTSDQTTRLDVTLPEEAVELQEIVVAAKRPVVETNLTSTRYTVSKEELAALPVQELQEVVNLQAGVVDGHFRGGRLGEVQYQVNGISVNDPYDNKAGLRIDRSLLQEVQVISGNFDAEYGQAMSGVVNAVLKSGGERFEWNVEAYGGDFLYSGTPRRPIEYESRPGSIQNYQASLSGPLGLPKTTFVLSAHRYLFDDYNWGARILNPSDLLDSTITGDGKEVALGYTHEWSGLVKLSNRSLSSMDFGYEALWSHLLGRRVNDKYRFNPDGLAKQETFSITHGFDFKHRLTPKTFYNVSVRQNYKDYTDHVYEDPFDPRYDEAGSPEDANNPFGYILGGVELTHFVQRTNSLVYKAQLTSQFRRDHLVKFGWESQLPRLTFGNDAHLEYGTLDGRNQLIRHIDEPPDFPAPSEFEPVQWAAYAQDEMEWSDVTLRGGLRLDYFHSRAFIPSDLANPANAISGAPASVPQAATRKLSFSPRLGVSYPVGKDAAVFFAYGHFYQMPGLGEAFGNANYAVLANLQVDQPDQFGVLGNPDIGPQRTVSYEFGYKQAVRENVGLDMTLFYKDIRDLLGVEFVETYTTAEYARFTNVDFGSVVGFTLALDQRPIGPFSATLDYTWQRAIGNSSDPRETATRASAGEDPRPRQVPFDWDQRQTLNLTLTLARPEAYTANAVLKAVSGQPYTPDFSSTLLGFEPEKNSDNKPSAFVVDLRGERHFRWSTLKSSVFARVFNLFDTRFFNGFVFADTGNPYYPSGIEAIVPELLNPNRLYAPRRIEVGVTLANL
jgi:hypothetical protein